MPFTIRETALLEVLYLDNHLMVVNKPPGLLVQEDKTGDEDVLRRGKEYLKEKFDRPGNVFLGLVHRIDRPASGVLVLARTSKAAARLAEQFRQRTVEKDYLAIVEGSLRGAGIAKDYLSTSGGAVRIVEATTRGARRAEMQWRAMGEEAGCSLVSIRLKTGRKHQIRIQLAALRHPILGDFRYGSSRELDGRNLALHCYRLGVVHPTGNAWMTFAAAPPASWGSRFAAEIKAEMNADIPASEPGN